MRPLPPTLREKKRYILIRMSGNPAQKDIYHAISDTAASVFGDFGAAKMHPAVVWSEDDYAVVRCTRGYEKEMIAVIACVSRCGGVDCVFHAVNTSGTIHGVKKKMGREKWDDRVIPGCRCLGKKVDRLREENEQTYVTVDDINK